MPIINEQIPSQNFELIRDQIGSILASELVNQHENNWLDFGPPTVWIERAIAFERNESAAINVRLNTGDYSNRNYTSVDGAYSFFVDFYITAPGSDDSDGDKLAALRVQRLMGMSRAILSNPAYATLGFQPGFIGSVTVATIAMGDPPETADAKNLSRGQLIVSIRATESEMLSTPETLAINSTSVRLYNTNKGYVYLWDKDVHGGVFSNEFTIQFE